jgi:CheY-like chemotaxis protein
MEKKILIIDDNEDFLFTMGVFLERKGFDVIKAEDGKVGWEKIQSEKPDLVLLDVMMEQMYSGFEVCQKIRNNPEFKSLPIISISAMANELGVRYNKDTDQEYFSPDEFIDKPVDKDLLFNTINKLLKI